MTTHAPESSPANVMPMTFRQPENGTDDSTIHTLLPPVNVPSVVPNTSLQHGCVEVVLSQMNYIPWNNPDNIVSEDVERTLFRIKTCVLALLFVFGGSGNMINMAVFYKQGLKDRVNLCLFALALADGLNLMTAMIYSAEDLLLQFKSKKTTGPVKAVLINHHFPGMMGGFGYVSSILSAIIACERCHCVLHPLTYQTAMRTRNMAAIVITVYVSVTGLYFLVTGFRIRPGCLYDPVTGEIKEKFVLGHFYKNHKQFLEILRSIFFGTGLPTAVIAVVIVTTIVTSVKLRQILKWRAAASISLSNKEAELTKMLVANSILFILCSIPVALKRNVSLFFPQVDIGKRNENLFMTLSQIHPVFQYINASFNILLYYVMGSHYREMFWALFGRKTERKLGMNSTGDGLSHNVNKPTTDAGKKTSQTC